jgi:hypothetical protein
MNDTGFTTNCGNNVYIDLINIFKQNNTTGGTKTNFVAHSGNDLIDIFQSSSKVYNFSPNACGFVDINQQDISSTFQVNSPTIYNYSATTQTLNISTINTNSEIISQIGFIILGGGGSGGNAATAEAHPTTIEWKGANGGNGGGGGCISGRFINNYSSSIICRSITIYFDATNPSFSQTQSLATYIQFWSGDNGTGTVLATVGSYNGLNGGNATATVHREHKKTYPFFFNVFKATDGAGGSGGAFTYTYTNRANLSITKEQYGSNGNPGNTPAGNSPSGFYNGYSSFENFAPSLPTQATNNYGYGGQGGNYDHKNARPGQSGGNGKVYFWFNYNSNQQPI